MKSIGISENSFESLSQICHQLKIMEFYYINVQGIENLLITNKNLLELTIAADGDMKEGYILEVLGLYYPFLQKCSLSYYDVLKDITETQIEVFEMFKFRLDLEMATKRESKNAKLLDKLLLYLGIYNHLKN